MAATSLSRMVVPCIALVAAFGAALVFGIQHIRRASPVDTKVATDVPAVSKPALDPRAQDPAALAAAKAKVDAMAEALAGSPLTPESGDGEPAFDIAESSRLAKRSSRAGPCRAQLWNYYGTVNSMIARSPINRDNSLWCRPAFPQALTT